MVAWATVEHELSSWFTKLTGMPELMARRIFFSVRNTESRCDMLAAVLSAGTFADAPKSFIESAVAKVMTYYSFRNRIAHGLALIDASDPKRFVLKWTDGQDEGLPRNPLTADRVSRAGNNFGRLATLIFEGRRAYSDQGRLEELREQVEMLPNPADSEKPSQKQLGRKRQRQSSKASRSSR